MFTVKLAADFDHDPAGYKLPDNLWADATKITNMGTVQYISGIGKSLQEQLEEGLKMRFYPDTPLHSFPLWRKDDDKDVENIESGLFKVFEILFVSDLSVYLAFPIFAYTLYVMNENGKTIDKF